MDLLVNTTGLPESVKNFNPQEIYFITDIVDGEEVIQMRLVEGEKEIGIYFRLNKKTKPKLIKAPATTALTINKKSICCQMKKTTKSNWIARPEISAKASLSILKYF